MKLDLKKMSAAICGPGKGKKNGSCTPSGNSRGAFSSSKRVNKTEGYKPPKGKIKFDEESVESSGGRRNDSYQMDFPGDVAPAGFGGGEGKKGTRFITTQKSGIRYVGQGKDMENPAAGLSRKQLNRIAKKKGQKSSDFFVNPERFKNTPGLPERFKNNP